MTFQFKLLREYEDGHQTERAVVFSDSTSSGLVPLWESVGVYDSLYNSDGKQARDVSRILAYGLDRINNDPSLEEKLSGAHVGSHAEAVRFLENVLKACTIHPPARIQTS